MPTLPRWDENQPDGSAKAGAGSAADAGMATDPDLTLPMPTASVEPVASTSAVVKTAQQNFYVAPPAGAANAAAATAAMPPPATDTSAPAAVDTSIPDALPAEKSQPESWVTSAASGRDSSSAHGRPKSLPSWAVSANDAEARRASAVFTSFEATPLDFVSLIKKAAGFYWANKLPLLLMAATLLGPVALLTSGIMAGLGRRGAFTLDPVAMLRNALVGLLVMGLAWPLTSGAISMAVIHRLQGAKIEPRAEWMFAVHRLMPLASAVVPAALVTALGYVLLVIPGLVASLFLALVPTVVMLETRQSIDALKRSASLMKDLLGRAAGVLVLFVVVALLLCKLLTLVIPGDGFFDLLASDLALIVLAPLPMIALTLLYLEQRRLSEGMTAESLQNDLDHLGS